MISKILKTVCLTLDKRIEQAIQIQNTGKELGLDIELFIGGDGSNKQLQYNHIDTLDLPPVYTNSITYPTWHQRPNAHNAWLCHQKIIQSALQESCANLLLLEDDVFFEPDFLNILDNIDDYFDTHAWDMIYFGWYSNNNLTPTDHPHVYKMSGGGGFHGVLINQEVMNQLSRFSPLGPYDWMCGKSLHNTHNCYAIYPSIITQQSGYSYVEDGILTKPARNKK